MVTELGKYCRTLLAGSLLLGGVAAISVVSGSIAASPAAATTPMAWTAYVVSNATDSVIPVNTATHAVGTPITVGSGPSAIAITPDGSTAYVADEGTTNTAPGFVTPIDLSTNTPGAPIPVGSGPDAIAITPNGSTAYVGNYNDDTVTPVSLVTNSAGTPIPVGAAPTSITITPDGSTAYVGRAFDSGIQLNLATDSVGSGVSPSGFASAITPNGATVVATSPQSNNVNFFSTSTQSGTTEAALNDPEGVAITPDGSTAYVGYSPFTTNKGALLAIPVANPSGPTKSINLGTNSAFAVAITPDGSTAFVTDLSGGDVVPVDLASGTAGTPIPLGSEGTNPFAIAITPDEAPVARMHVTIDGGLTDTFDASSSTVAHGSIASYAWSFGDGSTATTTVPTVTHTYASASPVPVASVAETSSTGTSTGEVFTGQTASAAGGPQATADVSVLLDTDQQTTYPSVSAVSPHIGSSYGPDTVTISGTFPLAGSLPGAQTNVYVGGVAATDVTFVSATTITATLPAQPDGVYDVVVTIRAGGYYFGSSAITPADQFTYSAVGQTVSTVCDSPSCPLPVVQYGSTAVSGTVGSDCNPCTYSALLAEGVPPIQLGSVEACPSAMGYEQSQLTVSESGATVNSPLTVADSQYWAGGLNWGSPNASEVDGILVCADAQALSGGAARRAPDAGGDASPAMALGQDIRLKKCAKKAVAPCVRQVAVSGHTVNTNVLLPVDESITLTVGPEPQTIKKISPKKGAAPGSELTITGTNLFQVGSVVIDGDPVGAGIIGGLPASIVSETSKKLVVTVPAGASTGPVTLIGESGEVTSATAVNVT
jgi:DNA-binding beta-propeller fold protein YncE